MQKFQRNGIQFPTAQRSISLIYTLMNVRFPLPDAAFTSQFAVFPGGAAGTGNYLQIRRVPAQLAASEVASRCGRWAMCLTSDYFPGVPISGPHAIRWFFSRGKISDAVNVFTTFITASRLAKRNGARFRSEGNTFSCSKMQRWDSKAFW